MNRVLRPSLLHGLVLYLVLVCGLPALAQSTPPGDLAAFDTGLTAWIIETIVTVGLAALGWIVIALLMWGASGKKFGKSDLILIGCGLAALIVVRVATYWVMGDRLSLLPNPDLYLLSDYLLALAAVYGLTFAAFFLTSLGYALRRAFTKKQIDKGGLVWWSFFYGAVFCGFMAINQFLPGRPVYFGYIAAFILLWLWRNPWMIVSQLGEYHKSNGNSQKALELLQKNLAKPRLNDKSRFVMYNDITSLYVSRGEFHRAVETGNAGLPYAHAFQSAEVVLRANLAESYLSLERLPEAVEQCAEIFRLTHAGQCFGGAVVWQGAGHALLAAINLRRGWLDEAGKQAELCLEKFPPEVANAKTQRSLIALAKTVQAGIRLAEKKPKAASRLCREALTCQQKNNSAAFIRTMYASALLARQKAPEAEEQCRLALQECELHVPAWFWLGHILRAQGRFHEAREAFREATIVYPEHPYAHRARQALSRTEPSTSTLQSTPAPVESSQSSGDLSELKLGMEIPPEASLAPVPSA